MSVPACSECKGTGKPQFQFGHGGPWVCGDCHGTGKDEASMVPGAKVDVVGGGEVTLIREMNGESSLDGWEVRRSDGKLAYLAYPDFSMTQADIDEVRRLMGWKTPAAERTSADQEKKT